MTTSPQDPPLDAAEQDPDAGAPGPLLDPPGPEEQGRHPEGGDGIGVTAP